MCMKYVYICGRVLAGAIVWGSIYLLYRYRNIKTTKKQQAGVCDPLLLDLIVIHKGV